MANALLNTDWWLDMERLFSPEFVARLDDREKNPSVRSSKKRAKRAKRKPRRIRQSNRSSD